MPNSTSTAYVIGITGASGALYGMRLLTELLLQDLTVELIISDAAHKVLPLELGLDLSQLSISAQLTKLAGYLETGQQDPHHSLPPISSAQLNKLRLFDNHNIAALCASGSHQSQAMIVAPCSMGSAARIAHGISNDLISRTADVCLKENTPLLLMPRETPFSSIHLQNLLSLKQAGAWIVPAMPAFYHQPQSIADQIGFVVGKALDLLQLPHQLYRRWGEIPQDTR